jgi:hypothetical protein
VFTVEGDEGMRKAGFFAVPINPAFPTLFFDTEPTAGDKGFHTYAENVFPLVCKFHPALVEPAEKARTRVWFNLENALKSDPILVLKNSEDGSFKE